MPKKTPPSRIWVMDFETTTGTGAGSACAATPQEALMFLLARLDVDPSKVVQVTIERSKR